MDICMMREYYIKVILLLKKVFEGTQYYVREILYNHMRLCIERKDSNDIGIDIYPIDKYFKSNIKGGELIITQKIISANKILRDLIFVNEKWDTDIANIRKAITKITEEYIFFVNKPQANDRPALFYGIDCPSHEEHGKSTRLIMDYDMIFPLSYLQLPLPNNYDEYLRNLYRNYLNFPKHFNREVVEK